MPDQPTRDHPRDLVISIINYRTAEMTVRCAASALADLGRIDGHVAIVDNQSGDGSVEAISAWIATLPPGTPVSLIASPTNTGFSGGHNLGMGFAPAAFCLILNSDALVRPGALATLMAAARDTPRAGILAPRLEDEDGTPQTSAFRIPGPVSELIRGAETGPVTKLLRHFDVPLPDPQPRDVGWVSFACVLLRGSMVAQIGPMDEGYFLYSEDTDYCWQARRAGWEIALVPAARIVHFRGGSAPVKRLAAARRRLPAYFYASRSRFFARAHGRAGLLAANLLWHLGRGLAQARRLFGKPVPPGIEAEARDIWINFLTPFGDPRRPER